MRDWKIETEKRVEFIKELIAKAGAKGVVYGNSGGKDSALVGILCKIACDNTVGVIMPCCSERNYGEDTDHGNLVADKFKIETRTVDLTDVKHALLDALSGKTEINNTADINIAPRLRMTTLYAIGAGEGLLVAGTGNRSERYMGYFTKWGDGACDFNPIADLTAGEVFDFLRYLDAPDEIIDKAPSAGLYEGQTDEEDMGVTYKAIDEYILNGNAHSNDAEIIRRYHNGSEHKRRMPLLYGEE